MFSTVLAILLWLAAIAYCIFVKKDECSAVYSGKRYYRQNELVVGTVEKLLWDGRGGYSAACRIHGEQDIVIVPLSVKQSHDMSKAIKPRIYLIKLVAENKYVVAPINGNIECGNLGGSNFLSPAEVHGLYSRLKAVSIVKWVLLVVELLLLFSLPVLAIAVSGIVIVLTKTYVQFKHLAQKSIGNAVEPVRKKEIKRPDIPKGFHDMSEIEKDLFDIEASIGARKMAEKEHEVDHTDVPEQSDGWAITNIEDADFAPFEPEGEPSVLYRTCKTCGCIADNDHYFCAQCGAQLDSPGIVRPNEALPEETSEKELPVKSDDAVATKPKQNRRRHRNKKKPTSDGQKSSALSMLDDFDV